MELLMRDTKLINSYVAKQAKDKKQKELFKILNERKVSYNLADFNVESGKKNTTQQTSQKVIDTLKNRPDVLNPLGN